MKICNRSKVRANVKVFISVASLIVALSEIHLNLYAAESETYSISNLLQKYCDAINANDIDMYIQLFSSDNQDKMNKYVELNGTRQFFHETEVQLVDNLTLENDSIFEYSLITQYELDKFEEYCSIYSLMRIKEDNELKEDYSVFVLVKENGSWRIYRKIVPNIKVLVDSGVYFRTEGESELLKEQSKKMSALKNQDGYSTYSLSEVCPTNIRVYFSKQENRSYYGKSQSTIDFQTYLKNVIPCEWYVSYYAECPSYLQAGAMASKMYAWYCTIHPMFNYSPYYADVDDSSESQNFLYNAYSSLPTNTYKSYVNYALGFCSHLAMVTEKTENIFCVQYRSNEGTIHSGILNQAKAYEMAKNGKSALEILQEYLGSTPYTKGEMIKFVGHN